MSNEARDQNEAAEVFREVVDVFERHRIDYAVGGGLASDHWTGGASRIGDIDVVIREEEAPQVLQHLGDAGFRTAEMERSWLHKAFKGGVTIDLIFELKNGTRFDDRFRDGRKRGEMFGTTCWVMSPEDQVAALAATVDRDTVADHWYSIIDLMAKNDLDWDYVVARSGTVPRRMLSVVHFAISEEVPVEKGVIEQLEGFAAERA